MSRRLRRSTTPTSPTNSVSLLDDRLLVAHVLGADLEVGPIATTTTWYYRMVRGSVKGAAGELHGPFNGLSPEEQSRAVEGIVIALAGVMVADAVELLPAIADVCGRHPQLNFMNVEATASAHVMHATVLLSPRAAAGVLPSVLNAEGIPWGVRDPFGDQSRPRRRRR